MNERKSHLRSIAVAGTLASVGAFTALAASSTHTSSTTAPVVAGQPALDQLQGQTQPGLDDGLKQSPGAAAVPAQDDDFFDQGQNQSAQGAFAGQSGTVAPPQPSMGPGGSGPTMSGGS